MGKSLVIVESPAKAKTINKYLGNQYVVKSSIGHIRDLPTSGSASASKEPFKRGKAAAAEAPALSPKEKAKRQLFARMGVDPEHGWKAKYEILPGKEKVIEELRRLAKDADTIYLATDLDREGEAIAWHLREAIGGDDSRYKRVVFNEITKKAIQEAFSQPGELDINRVNAQQARRFLDRVVGYMVSPLLWAKIARGLSAGRVQSVAVKLVVEREKEIRAFVPEEYWEVHADLGTAKSDKVRFEVVRENGEAFKPLNEAQAMAALAKLKDSSYSVVKREDKPTSSKPTAPFITSTLQQAASNRLGFGVKKTMMMAQRLYEAGYITYMRTDSTNLSNDAIDMVRGFIDSEFGKKYLPAKPNFYSSKEGAQEAHEAIRPSDVNLRPTQLSGMERDAERLYELIWRQFVACQMPPAEYLSTSVSVAASGFELRAKGRILKFDGYTKVLPQQGKPGDDDVLPEMKEGEALKLLKLDPSQHFTKPPARFSEASLVKELEKRGIGRPSTYAAIISTIQERGYVAVQNRRFYAEKMGDIVTERLDESFANLMDYGFTAAMEEHLDDVAQGERDWKHLLDEFYGDFKKKLEVAGEADKGMRANQPTPTDIACRDCGRPMMIRTASTGVFLGCSGYALPPKERCKATINLIPGDEIAADDEGESESRVLLNKHRCPICATAMDAYLLDETRKLHICGNNPDCIGYEIEQGQYRIKGYEGPSLECDKCGSEMQLKTGRFGKFFGCTNASCKNTRKLLKSGEAAPPKMDAVKMPELKCEKVDDTYVLRDGASGLFLAASGFPKNRETRAPLVLELIPHKDEIDPKYHFLLEAPKKDPEGRPAVIRYSRKTKEQYVQSEVDGKPTGWRAFFDGGKWKVEDKR
ncbi:MULTISPECIES: type I DNA topoisomerase [unclassified Pseudomonas]|uniref:type I DNA topoisomerase n=1 Tax=unclassified Pseudomonas TaxID=196821 RepID=UPI00244AD61E|nr:MULTISPECIES: type I DNA topoisomerase [unclassified Pseudomonas]MDG9924003.1 type I DNA topoisomerase [Pseudomonas sp. GD04045]MDH0035010.1 type I DNA topoisomerase [Pseudomonas sp. GD04019]